MLALNSWSVRMASAKKSEEQGKTSPVDMLKLGGKSDVVYYV